MNSLIHAIKRLPGINPDELTFYKAMTRRLNQAFDHPSVRYTRSRRSEPVRVTLEEMLRLLDDEGRSSASEIGNYDTGKMADVLRTMWRAGHTAQEIICPLCNRGPDNE